MSYYTVEIPGEPLTHASPTERGTVLYCDPGRHMQGKVIQARVTCPECRAMLTKSWRDLVTGEDYNDFIYCYEDNRGWLAVTSIDHVPHEREPFVRMHYITGLQDFYTLEHFVRALVDGNAYTIMKPAAGGGEKDKSETSALDAET